MLWTYIWCFYFEFMFCTYVSCYYLKCYVLTLSSCFLLQVEVHSFSLFYVGWVMTSVSLQGRVGAWSCYQTVQSFLLHAWQVPLPSIHIHIHVSLHKSTIFFRFSQLRWLRGSIPDIRSDTAVKYNASLWIPEQKYDPEVYRQVSATSNYSISTRYLLVSNITRNLSWIHSIPS